MDPYTKEVVKEPMKPFMVNQLTIAFEREQLILSPYDEVLHKQLIDYEVERVSQSGMPIYTSENEHFVDTLGLAYLAFVMEFPELTATVKEARFEMAFAATEARPGQKKADQALRDAVSPFTKQVAESSMDDDLPGDRPVWREVKSSYGRRRSSWGSRTGGATRTIW